MRRVGQTRSSHMRNRKKRQSVVRRIFLICFLCVLGLIMAVIVTAAVYIAPYADEHMDMTLLDLPAVNRPATLYVRDPAHRAMREGELTVAPHSSLAPPERRIYVPYEEMPEDLINAFVAIEDKRFFGHHGVDVRRTGAAAVGYLTKKSSFGGSTITQQLVKNLTGHDESTVDRKLREIFMALDLERHADKEQILECYLNIINLSEGCRGVGAAANRYFSKSTAELTLAECATIAAITQNPARYNPLRHPEAVKTRRNLILNEMAKQGYITPARRDTAISAALSLLPGTFASNEDASDSNTTSWYADMVAEDVIRDLCDRCGYTRSAASDLLYTAGLHIEIAMDRNLQAIVDEYYANLTHFPVGTDGRPQSSCILIDPYTGDIMAVAGAIGEKTAARVQNYATDCKRPAGSAIKPLSLFAPAIEEGLVNWSSRFDDSPVSEKNGVPWPRNADGMYRGEVTLEEAVADSLNTVAVRLLEEVGEARSFSYLRDRFGLAALRLPSDGRNHDLTVSSLALGQQSYGVTSRDLTAAYTVFFGGIYRPAVSYHRVLDRDGQVLLENPLSEGKTVISPSTAALMTRLLGTVTDHGTAAKYLSKTVDMGIPTAGKTGTTQNNCDRRFIGYTPHLLAGVWMGYDYPAELRGIAGNPCVRIWDEIIAACEQSYVQTVPRMLLQDDFHTPGLIECEFCPQSGTLPNAHCPSDTIRRGWFIRGTEPRDFCTFHEEPPIRLVPDDPVDPDRIPLLPDDLIKDLPPIETPSRTPWFSRWFSRFSGRR